MQTEPATRTALTTSDAENIVHEVPEQPEVLVSPQQYFQLSQFSLPFYPLLIGMYKHMYNTPYVVPLLHICTFLCIILKPLYHLTDKQENIKWHISCKR